MKNKLLILLFALIISLPVISQTNPRLVNENYMHTVFFEDFLDASVNRSVWEVVDDFKRGLGVLIDSPLTLAVNNENLELKMLYSPGYNAGQYSGDYVGGEIISYSAYRYGSFECLAKFAYQSGS